MEKQQQTGFVHRVRLGKRQRLADKAAQSLPQNIVEPLNVAGLPVTLARRLMLLFGQHLGVGFPEVGEQHTLLIPLGDALPQQAAGGLRSCLLSRRLQSDVSFCIGPATPSVCFSCDGRTTTLREASAASRPSPARHSSWLLPASSSGAATARLFLSQISTVLGAKPHDEVIHRDNLVLDL